MRRVIIESPYAADTPEQVERNIDYLLSCMADCLLRGEAPFASHALYPQVLNDKDPAERAIGIGAGLAWGSQAEATVVYDDFGITPGMETGIKRAHDEGRPVEYRKLYSREEQCKQGVLSALARFDEWQRR